MYLLRWYYDTLKMASLKQQNVQPWQLPSKHRRTRSFLVPKWLKNNSLIHTIKTKLMARDRLEIHNDGLGGIGTWERLEAKGIRKRKYMYD